MWNKQITRGQTCVNAALIRTLTYDMTAAAFRETFAFASKEVAHYFPGHMAKGMKQMQSKLKNVDCIIEVHDARIPFSGRNPQFKSTLQVRPHLLVLNKQDLADLSCTHYVEERLRAEGVNSILYTNCKEQANRTVKKKIIPEVMNLINSVPRYHRTDVDEYSLLVIGVPNVGKSSLINAIRRCHIGKGKATRVGAEAGITRSVLERIKISDNPKLYVYDTPGILNPVVENIEVGMKLALCATLKDHLVGEDIIADYLLYWMNKHGHFKYVKHFGLSEPTDDVLRLLLHIAQQKKSFVKRKSLEGGYIQSPNVTLAAQIILKAFREGHLGKFNLDQDETILKSKEKDMLDT